MTSEAKPVPTRIRARLTAEQPGPVHTELVLSDDALAGLARVTGGRPAEELVVLGAAGLLVLGAMEHTQTPALLVELPHGKVTASSRLSELSTLADVVRALDTDLRIATEPSAEPSTAAETMLVRSVRVSGDKTGPVDGIELTLSEGAGGQRVLAADTGLAEPWFLEVLLQAMEATLAEFRQPQRVLAELARAAADDVETARRFAGQAFDPVVPKATLISPIRQAVLSRPDDTAVFSGGETLTYGLMWERAEAVAGHLAERGIGAGDRVILLLDKSLETVPVILGVLLSRAAYVPLDVRWPAARVAAIVRAAAPAAVVVSAGLRENLPECDVPVLAAADLLRAGRSAPAGEGPIGSDPAYVAYTSGSTGVPKGVVVTHAAIASYIGWKVAYHGLSSDSRLLQTASFAFDGGTSDLFSILSAGGGLVLVDMNQTHAEQLAEIARRHRITDVNTVPSLYRVVLDDLASAAESLRLVTVAGETTTPDLVARHHELLPHVRLVNEYGPTECSIAATAFDHATGAGPGSPIGRPIANTVLTVSDEDGRPLPAGFVGELRIGGHGLADGYLGEPGQTAAAFVADDAMPGGRAYRSGDLGWWRPDGMLEFAGRGDNQVKIRGQRVEVGEVEAALGLIPGVRANSVVVTADPAGSPALVAFVEGEPSAEQIRAAAAVRLPPVMRPARIEVLDALPRMANGKLDRARLAELAALPVPAPGNVLPIDETVDEHVRTVAEVLGELLGTPPPRAEDDFFEIGGHSIMALSAISALEKRTGVALDLDEFMTAATVEGIAALLRGGDPMAKEHLEIRPVEDPDVLWRLLPKAGDR